MVFSTIIEGTKGYHHRGMRNLTNADAKNIAGEKVCPVPIQLGRNEELTTAEAEDTEFTQRRLNGDDQTINKS